MNKIIFHRSIAVVSLAIITMISYATKLDAAGFPKGPQAPLQELENAAAATPKNSQEKKSTSDDQKSLSLGKIETEVENDLTIITARLSRQPAWKDLVIEDHGTFLQIKLPATAIPNSGEFLDGNGPFLKKIATFQVGNEDGALRFFINQDASKAKLATTAELLGERVVITIDHKKLEQLIQPVVKEQPLKTEPVIATAPKLDAAPAEQQVTAAAQSAAKVETPAAGPLVGSNDSLDLKGKLVTAAIFCAAMLAMLIGAHFLKNRRRKSGKAFKGSPVIEPAAMKILSNINLSARQKLALVQVGSQQILIGVSPDNITFLTNVESTKPKPPQSFGTHLLNANPNAEVKVKAPEPSAARPQRTPQEASVTGTSRPVAPRPKAIGPDQSRPQPSSRVNYAVGDDGIADLRSKNVKIDKTHTDQPFDDITKLIRDRLRNLPPSP